MTRADAPARGTLVERLRAALRDAAHPYAEATLEPLPDKGLAHDHVRLVGSGVLARLPKLTDGTYRSTFIDALASEERGAGLYRARGEREGRSIDIEQLLLFTIRGGLVTEVLALPSDPAAFDAFWAE